LIDLSDATYMDSAGVQAVLNAYVRVNRAGGRIAVVTQHEIVISILQIISADRLPGFFLCENVDAAAKMLADAEPA
jgi:anti-anti-sigma factor